MKQPPKWKFTIMVWIALYPTILTVNFLIGNHIKELSFALKTLISTAIIVPVMVFVLLPIFRKILGNWLNK